MLKGLRVKFSLQFLVTDQQPKNTTLLVDLFVKLVGKHSVGLGSHFSSVPSCCRWWEPASCTFFIFLRNNTHSVSRGLAQLPLAEIQNFLFREWLLIHGWQKPFFNDFFFIMTLCVTSSVEHHLFQPSIIDTAAVQ